MRIITRLLSYLIFFTVLVSCQPKQGTIEDKEAVKGDTLDVREGSGEGTVGEGEQGVEDIDSNQ